MLAGFAAVVIVVLSEPILRSHNTSHATLPLSSSMFLLKVLSALVALLLIASVRAETNVTIDDTDPRIEYRPSWSFQGDTDNTQDRFNKTTHFTSKQGATASLTFSGALYVFYVGYGIRDLPSPAFIPITLQPQRGSLITVQSDAYRPSETRAQAVLFSSDRLDLTETYTITVTKTNDTSSNSINVDAFILTQPDDTTVKIATPAGGITLTSIAPPVTTGAPGATNTATGTSIPTSAIANDSSRNASPNAAAIAGGVLGGIAFGIIVAFFAIRWWSNWDQRKRGLIGPDGLPIAQYSDEYPHYEYPRAAPPYPAKHFGSQPQSRTPAVVDRRRHRHRHRHHHSVPSTFSRAPAPLTPLSSTPGQSSVSGGTDMAQAQRFAYIPPMRGKAQYMGSIVSTSTPPSHLWSPSPEDSEYDGTMLPAYPG